MNVPPPPWSLFQTKSILTPVLSRAIVPSWSLVRVPLLCLTSLPNHDTFPSLNTPLISLMSLSPRVNLALNDSPSLFKTISVNFLVHPTNAC